MNTRIRHFAILITISILSANCTSPKLKEALKEAGKNREELENVLSHYKNDSEKYKAACFLIENMSQYTSYYSSDMEIYDHLFRQLDSLQKFKGTVTNSDRDSLVTNFKSYNGEFGVSETKRLPDLQYIKAEHLIENIDLAFYVWKNMSWAKHLNFNEFCEYILPYRIKNEPLTKWREYLLKKYSLVSSQVLDTANHLKVLARLRESIGKYFTFDESFNVYPFNFGLNELITARRGVCENKVNYIVFSCRSLGIPVVCDYVPQWGNRSMSHIWYATFTKEGKKVDFLIDGIDRYNIEGVDYGLPKVYRITFKMQDDVPAVIEKDIKYLPSQFRLKNFIDVSKDYMNCHDVDLKLAGSFSTKAKLAYLCVFDNVNWIPVCWGEIKHNNVKFRAIGGKLVYLPAIFSNDSLIPISEPFVLSDSGNVFPFRANMSKLNSLVAKRKYPIKPRIRNYVNRMKSGCFEVANNAKFVNAKPIYKISGPLETQFVEVILKESFNYRFLRYVSPNNSYGDIAEIEVFSDEKKLEGEIIGVPGKKNNPLKNAFDGNKLTFYETDNPNDSWVGIDFKCKEKITKIKFLPRNDQNNVEKGSDYGLFYWDSRWVPVGRRIATSDSIVFNKVPSNCLYFFHCYSGGKEERIFSYENGKQIWW